MGRGGEGKGREGRCSTAGVNPPVPLGDNQELASRAIPVEVQGGWGISPLTPQSCPWCRAAGRAFSLPHVLLALCIVPVAEPQRFVTAVSGV